MKPLLLIDVDGVISLFDFRADQPPDGTWMMLDGQMHLISAQAGGLLTDLAAHFELVWCTGWEDRANDQLRFVLGLPHPLPVISFDRVPGHGQAHWKLAAIDAFVGRDRPVAWIDDRLDDACAQWAAARRATGAPTLLIRTDPAIGVTAADARRLQEWPR